MEVRACLQCSFNAQFLRKYVSGYTEEKFTELILVLKTCNTLNEVHWWNYPNVMYHFSENELRELRCLSECLFCEDCFWNNDKLLSFLTI